MPQPTKQELSDTLDRISELADDALDPELTREELVAKVKEIADMTDGEDSDVEDNEDDEDEDEDSGD